MKIEIDNETLEKLKTKGTTVYLRQSDNYTIKYIPELIIQSGLSTKSAIGYALAGLLYWDSRGVDQVKVNLIV